MAERPLRVLLAKPGLDGHDRGVLVVAAALRDAGFEVIYTGLRQSAETIAAAAADEDVDAIGLSVLSGAHKTLVPKVVEALAKRGLTGLPLVLGGIIPAEDRAELERAGVAGVFGPGTTSEELVRFFRERIGRNHDAEQGRATERGTESLT